MKKEPPDSQFLVKDDTTKQLCDSNRARITDGGKRKQRFLLRGV